MTTRTKSCFSLLGLLLLAVPLFGQVGGESVKKNATDGWGPTWWTGLPPGGFQRDKPLKEDRYEFFVTDKGKGDGVTIGLWCDVADKNLKAGDTYQLMYQLRLLGAKGEPGLLLATKDFPNGIALGVSQKVSDGKEAELEARCHITKKLLKEFTNLPLAPWVAVRFEPQLRNVTTGKYLLPAKTKAIVLVLDMYPDGTVTKVETLGKWIYAIHPERVGIAEDVLARLDDYSPGLSGLSVNLLMVLEKEDGKLSQQERAKLIPFIPNDALTGNFSDLKKLLEKFAAGDDEHLKAAAEKKLAIAKAEAKK